MPMRRLTFCFVLAALCMVCWRKTDNSPKTITFKDGKVSAVFPHQPMEGTDGEVVTYVYEARGPVSAYSVSQGLSPDAIDLTDKDCIKKVFETLRDASVLEFKGKILSDRVIDLADFPGYTFDIGFGDCVYRTRIYLTRKSFVQIAVVGPQEFVDGPEAKKFLDSLKIKE